uniref:Uncharacterized protein n=1 Tax=Meloidogyne enterolobii TaxID=390850 RepID=A0A6V7XB50_MELEN|nr:unnamed protein product [Meloidogyne enterolobii]
MIKILANFGKPQFRHEKVLKILHNKKEETKTRLRNRSLILFQQPKLNKGGGNNNWWPLKRIKNRSIEKKNSYGVPPPPSMLSDEINGEEEIQSLENRPLIDLTVTSSENDSPCSSLPPNQPTTIDDSNTTTTSTTTTTTFISFRPQRCQFLENFDENKNNNNSEFNKHQRRAKSFRHFPSTRTYNNSRRSTRFSTASGSAHLLKKSPFISNICPITGLTPIQRRMIIERVCKLKTLDLHTFCSSTYKNVFEKYPKLISYFCLNTSIKRKKSEKEIILKEEEENKKERNGKGICRRLSSIGIFRMLVRVSN